MLTAHAAYERWCARHGWATTYAEWVARMGEERIDEERRREVRESVPTQEAC